MRFRITRITSLVIGIILLGGALSIVGNRNKAEIGQDQKQVDVDQKQIDVSDYPVVEYAKRNGSAERKAKSKKYNDKYAPRINESTEQVFHIIDWDTRLPAFPITQSAAIVIGEVTEATAHLSEDETNIYSEFSIRVDEILKDDIAKRLVIGTPFIAQREGGRVRFATGKTAAVIVNHQNMPRIGRKYVFFLDHQSLKAQLIDDYYLLTAFELRAGRVFPLDSVSARHPIAAYKGAQEIAFLADLRAAIALTN
jgi:hypothetical protein